VTVTQFDWRERGGVRVLVPHFFGELGLLGGYSTRLAASGQEFNLDLRGAAGKEEVLAARRDVCAAMGVSLDSLVIAEQVHGSSVAVVFDRDRGRGALASDTVIPGVDALVTAVPGVALAGLSADCAIVLLADEKRRAVAAVHSGRKGTAANIVAAAVRTLVMLGIPPSSLYAAIGPTICRASYEVGDEVKREFETAFPSWPQVITIASGRPHLDLPGVVTRELVAAGLRAERIFDSGLCTVCRNDLFYSYRKEGAAAGRTAGVISIAE
jgi:YfiH family protein